MQTVSEAGLPTVLRTAIRSDTETVTDGSHHGTALAHTRRIIVPVGASRSHGRLPHGIRGDFGTTRGIILGMTRGIHGIHHGIHHGIRLGTHHGILRGIIPGTLLGIHIIRITEWGIHTGM